MLTPQEQADRAHETRVLAEALSKLFKGKDIEVIQTAVDQAIAEIAAKTKETLEIFEAFGLMVEHTKSTAQDHDYYGFGSEEDLTNFLDTVPQKLSMDTLATLKALKPRETAESHVVLFACNGEIYLGESAPSSKGANGEEGGGIKIAATEAAKEMHTNALADYYSQTGSAEQLFKQLADAGAKDLICTSRPMLRTLRNLRLFSREIPIEWLSDVAAPGAARAGSALNGQSFQNDAYCAIDGWGVRALRNVSKELAGS